MPNQYERLYDPEICSKIPLLFSDGASITEVSVKLGISRQTYYAWREEYPQFKAACRLGEQIAEVYHERKLADGADGKIDGFSAPARIFLMKNRYREVYGEQKEEKTATDTLLEQLLLGKAKIVNND